MATRVAGSLKKSLKLPQLGSNVNTVNGQSENNSYADIMQPNYHGTTSQYARKTLRNFLKKNILTNACYTPRSTLLFVGVCLS